MSEPFDPQGLQFSEAPTPDHTASGAPAPEPTPEEPRRRFLPGRGPNAGTRDNATRGERTNATKPPREKKPLPPIPTKGFAPGVIKMYQTLAAAVTPFDVALGNALLASAEEAGEAWDELARQNQTVRRFLAWMLESTAWGKLLQAHAPIVGLMFARMMGQDQRQTLASLFLGEQAERFANGEYNQNNGDGMAGPNAA